MPDLELRHWIYATLAATGRAPTRADVAARIDDDADGPLRDLHDAHMIVLGHDGEISMALPFSNHPTGHRVTSDTGAWWANCAWDSLAIPAALATNATVEATWLDTGEAVDLAVVDGRVEGDTDGFVHFRVPARHWWDDIVET